MPTGVAMDKAIGQACGVAAKLLDEYAPVEITYQRYTEKSPHPGNQQAFTIRAQLPWQRQAQTRVMVEISVDEKLLKPVQNRDVIHEYGEPLAAKVRVYALEEIVAEKLRAILQHSEKLDERGWSRSRARDYYDLWRIFGTYRSRMELRNFASFLSEKCAVRKVSFQGPGDFFQEQILAYVDKTWDQWLGPLVSDLPSFPTVISELRPQIEDLLSSP